MMKILSLFENIPTPMSMAYNDSSRETNRYPPRDDGRGPRKPSQNFTPAVTKPTPCNLVVNLFKYTGKNTDLHQYSVTFTPEIIKKNIFNKFIKMVAANSFKEPYAFDGAGILVSTKKFPDTVLKLPGEKGDLECKIEHKHSYNTGNISAGNPGVLQCMEIISRFYQTVTQYVDRNRMYILESKPFDLGCGLEVITGLTSSIKLNKQGVYLNLDTAFGVFYKRMPLLDFLAEFARTKDSRGHGGDPLRDNMGTQFYNDFERLIKGVQVETVHREKNSSFRVFGIHQQAATSVEFEIDGKRWTVAEYFAKTYKALRYPQLPLVAIKRKEMMIYLPMEVLRIGKGQKYAHKLDERMTAEMIKIAAKRPGDRFDTINSKAVDLAALKNSTMSEFGMAFDAKMINCKGVILPPPQVVFSDRNVSVNNGSWNLIGAKALQGSQINEWKIFSFNSHTTVRPDTINTFIEIASKYGIMFNPKPQTAVVRNVNEFFDAPKAKLNLIILPDKTAQRYEEIKRIAETYQGVYTQCMVASNLNKLSNPSFASNLLLKINAKLGGKNWSISKKLLRDKPTILFGMDVTHPGIGDLEGPSIASVVATMDYDFVGYRTIIQMQERRQEVILTLKDHVQTLLKGHYGCTSTKPSRIVVFRDGIGDSMFDMVYACEIKAIEEACLSLDASYKPEINFIIAQKRHSVRFKSEQGNAVPGTVVDEIGAPDMFDFYLVSHNAIQGTARPVRYTVIRNDSKFSNMDMYEMTYSLCHLYARATKSVSLVPPVYYADLAAARGKCYLEKNKDGAIIMRPCDKGIQKSLFYL